MRRLLLAMVMLLALCAGGMGVRAQEPAPEQAMLMKLFGSDPITPDMFTPGFLTQVSIEQILAVFAKTRASVGAPQSVEPAGRSYVVHSATYSVPVDIALDGTGRIGALLLHPAIPNFASTADVLSAVNALGSRVGYLVTYNGQGLYAHNETVPLAVSSAFKLAVLAAAADEVKAGRLAWDKVVELKASEVSLPSGVLQTLPVGSPLTVHTLAAFMISQSDNTATDMLIDLVGGDKVAAKLGSEFVLRTAEFFKLKADPALKLRFAGADTAGRLKAINDMAGMALPEAADVLAPLDAGIEWYAPPSRLCSLMEEVKDIDVFTINPGVARPADWQQISFKGGSEVGVASLVTALTDKAGNRYCVAMTWNDDKALDETKFTALYGALLDKLGGN